MSSPAVGYMWIVTGHLADHGDFPIEIEATGASLPLAKAIAGEGDGSPFRRVPITQEQAAQIVEAEEWPEKWGQRPHFTGAKFTPPEGLAWQIVVQALHRRG